MMATHKQMLADPEKPRFFRDQCKAHKAILMLLLLAAVLIFPNFGRDALWNDEGDTAYWGMSIRHSGLPLAWDGRNFSAEDSRGLTEGLIYVNMPWLSLYASAASMTIFGENTSAARFPFALAGWATVLALYLLVLRATGDKKAALYAAGMLLLCVTFFLYARSCRYYAFVMLFTSIALWIFLKLDDRRQVPVFALTVILLFYSLYLPAICVLAALTFLVLVYKPFHKYRRGLIVSLLMIVPVTLPWLLWTYHHFSGDVAPLPLSLDELLSRAGQVMIEIGSAAPLLGWLALLFMAKRPLLKKYAPLLVLCGTVIAVSAAADICMHSADQMATFGLRHYCGIIPLAAVLSGLLIVCTDRKLWATMLLMLLLGATHLGGNFFPWFISRSENQDRATLKKITQMHVPDHWLKMVFRYEIPGYLLELFIDNPGTTTEICKVLLEQTAPGDKLFVNYAWEPIYFYTRLQQVGKLAPISPAYKLARQHGVPEEVADASAADWAVWRSGWGFYQYGDKHWKYARAQWKKQGKTLTEVARIKDTLWENRPNLYFHRFPGFGYLYPNPWPVSFPDAVIYHVE